MAAQTQDSVPVTEPVTKPAKPLTVADHTTDVIFVVEEKQIHFTKLLLTLCSPVFDRMFHGDFAEKSSKEIPLPGKNYEDMITFLKLIHPAHAHSTHVTDDNLLNLLDLSREYQVESVRNKCQQYIGTEAVHAERKLTADRLLLFLYVCDQYELKQHIGKLETVAQAGNIAAFKSSKNFKKFSSTPSFLEVLSSRCESLERVLADLKKVVEKGCPYLPKKEMKEIQCKCRSSRYCGDSAYCEECGLVKMKIELQSLTKKAKDLSC